MSDLPQFKLRDYVRHMTQAIEQVAEYLEDVTEAQFLCTRLLSVRRRTWLSKNSQNSPPRIQKFHGKRFITCETG